MTYWNSAALYGGWGMPEDLSRVRNADDLSAIGESSAKRDWDDFKDWLPLNIQRTRNDAMVQNLIYQAVGLKYVLDSLAVSAYTATDPKTAEQYKMTALAYKDAYAPFMRTSLYKGIARYYSGQAPASKKGFKTRMSYLAEPTTVYNRKNLAGYLRTPIGASYIGRVAGKSYRTYDKITAKGRDRLLALRDRGMPLIGQVPPIPDAYEEYIKARAANRAAAEALYAAEHPKSYEKTLARLKERQKLGWIPALRSVPVQPSGEDIGGLPFSTPGSGGPGTTSPAMD